MRPRMAAYPSANINVDSAQTLPLRTPNERCPARSDLGLHDMGLAEDDDVSLDSSSGPTADTLLLESNRGRESTTGGDGSLRRLLYTSHFLSTWNSRMFEFGAFLFLADIYPDTLLPASIYALARSLSAVLLSSSLGRYIDRADRLEAVRWSILGQRLAVAASCVLLFVMEMFEKFRVSSGARFGSLAALSLLACVEKLSSVLNTISVERDWVVTIAGDDDDHLRLMNSQMRRIDLFCKLAAPLFISLIHTASPKVAIALTGGMTVVSVAVEYFSIARVYNSVPALAYRMERRSSIVDETPPGLLERIRRSMDGLLIYLQHRAFLPSFSLAMLYLTVLSFNGQMITYLLAINVPASLIGVLRGISAMFELSATWLGPALMRCIGPTRAGIWALNWEFVWVVTACSLLWFGGNTSIIAVGLTTAVIVSRVGLWGFDLSAQIIIQDEVEPEHRGTFSSYEFTFQNGFEMLSFASTIVFSHPADFKYPATISAVAVGIAAISYAAFVRLRRGHLVHWSPCVLPRTKSSTLSSSNAVPEFSS